MTSTKVFTTEDAFKNFFKRWPVLYNFLFFLVGPMVLTGLISNKFVRRFPSDAKILHAGSGTKRPSPNCVNVDVLLLQGVDIVSDLSCLSVEDGAFDAVTCEQVLEHVTNPYRAAEELCRVTKPGGQIHVATPFVFPWHPSPSDYTRWTLEGLCALFPGCEVMEKGVLAGPFSAFVAFMASFLGVIFGFGSRSLAGVIQYIVLILCIPLKFLDFFFARIPGAEHCAAGLYVVMRKA